MQINLFDINFKFMKEKVGYDSLSYCRPQRMEWVREHLTWEGATVFADEYCLSPIVDHVKTDFKVAWLLEPPGIKNTADYLRHVQHKFDLILSYLPLERLQVDPHKFICLPSAGSWVQPQEITVKSKMSSIIASAKRDTFGHRLRHEIVDIARDNMDLYGDAYQKLESKTTGLLPYRFSVVIENEKYPMFFSEKLIDCMLCRCIPIYWGATAIDEIFDSSGILHFSNKEDARKILQEVSIDKYDSLRDAIEYNYTAAVKYARIDDIMHDVILQKMTEKLSRK